MWFENKNIEPQRKDGEEKDEKEEEVNCLYF